ncbi:hypothetical protein KO528_04340 [Saccharophagus degradans]|uniref:hypothetical protein n=1 Tax=Saccharophagus degradans TaxID=86304 RepID=UPI001C081C9E|nr:hypothetical protein [Saccharophagus degradans]MBU2984563.1 hypothetical protein [Saccharophagus degradans]
MRLTNTALHCSTYSTARLTALISVLLLTSLTACSEKSVSPATSNTTQINTVQEQPRKTEFLAQDYIDHNEVFNPEAPIPAQCYTKTESKFNPCYVCHQTYSESDRPNQMHDGFQQGSYAFSDVGVTNSWKNLFVNREEKIKDISDEFILDYIQTDNYTPLIEKLKNSDWSGVVPELKHLEKGAEAFDEYGLAKDGSQWVAFNYKPLPSTFWPTNGSTDDVMIKLATPFTQINGEFSRQVYFANLALLELAITGKQSTSLPPTNEIELQLDLDSDGKLTSNTTTIHRRTHYIGDAHQTPLAHMLYPEGTAFLHSVRYVGVGENGEIFNPPRMKELRYMKKQTFLPTERLSGSYYREAKEKHFGNLPYSVDKQDKGMSNGFGWQVLGFIEDEQGNLRKQHSEEQAFCMGCHKTIGTTIDQTFAFPRKVAGAEGWGYINLKTIKDVPNIRASDLQPEEQGEYLTYLERVGGGDEFRQNSEMLARWFTSNGVNKAEVESLESIYDLITPSKERALALNKAYYTIVKEQSYLFGRDTVLLPATNVYTEVDESEPPLLPQHRHQWDIRLDWSANSTTGPQSVVAQ